MFEPLIRRLERLSKDERGVSPVVGFVLIFALIMLVFTIYQADVVPAQNSEVEFEHSQMVEGQMAKLNDALHQAATSGSPQSMTLDTGVQYPSRALAINPGSPTGTLRTIDASDVTISGVSDSSGYWNSSQSFSTKFLSYQSNYNRLQQETEYTLENGMFTKDYEPDSPSPTNTVIESKGGLISNNGKQINLVLIGGQYQESAMTSSVTAEPVNTSTEYVEIETESRGGTISVPTTLPRSAWEDLLGTTYNSGKNNVKLNPDDGDSSTIEIGLEGGETYSLRLSKIYFGGDGSSSLTYLERESGRTNRTAAVGTPETFTVSVHDQFGNPYAGAPVDASTSGSGNFTRSNTNSVDDVATGDDGRATFTYTPGEADAGDTTTVTFTLDNRSISDDLRNVTYNLTVPPQGDENTSGTQPPFGAGDITNGYTFGVIVDEATLDDIRFNNTGSKDVNATAVRISGSFDASGGSDIDTESISFDGQEIIFNGGMTPLDANISIPSDETTSVEFEHNTGSANVNGGFLIVTVKYNYTVDGEPETTTVTYAISLAEGGGSGGPGRGN